MSRFTRLRSDARSSSSRRSSFGFMTASIGSTKGGQKTPFRSFSAFMLPQGGGVFLEDFAKGPPRPGEFGAHRRRGGARLLGDVLHGNAVEVLRRQQELVLL